MAALLAVGMTAGIVCLTAAPASARTGALQENRAKAHALATEISSLDGRIGAAVTRYSRATRALEAVRRQLKDNRRLQRLAYKELGLARATLAARAVAMYKHNDVSPMDAVLGAADLSDLVTQLTMVRTIARCDRDVVRTIETTKRELSDRAETLAADERTAEKLVGTCKTELATIRARLERTSRRPRGRALGHPRPGRRRGERFSGSQADRRAAAAGRRRRRRRWVGPVVAAHPERGGRATASTPAACTAS